MGLRDKDSESSDAGVLISEPLNVRNVSNDPTYDNLIDLSDNLEDVYYTCSWRNPSYPTRENGMRILEVPVWALHSRSNGISDRKSVV